MAMFFARNQFWGKADARFNSIKRTHEAGEYLVAPAVFAPMKEFIPFQPADILANLTRSYARHKYHQAEWSPQQLKIMQRLASYNGVGFTKVTRDMLEDTERMHIERLARRKARKRS